MATMIDSSGGAVRGKPDLILDPITDALIRP